jgi:hypothetical protein
MVIEGLPKAQKRGQASELTQVYCKVSSEFGILMCVGESSVQ